MFQNKNTYEFVRSSTKAPALRLHFLLGMTAMAMVLSGCDVSRHYYQVTSEFWEKVDSLAKADQKNQQLIRRVAELEAENEQLRGHTGHGEVGALAEKANHESNETGHHGARSVASLLPEAHHNHTKHNNAHAPDQHAHVASEEHKSSHTSVHDNAHEATTHAISSHGGNPHTTDSHETTAHESANDHSAVKGHAANEHAANHNAQKELVFGADEPQEAPVDFSIMSIPPKKLYGESIAAYKRKEFDRAARGFLALVNNKENPIYSNPENMIITGICLYQLQNYKQANLYFDRVLQVGRMPASMLEQAQSLAPKALSWKALSLQKLNRAVEAKQVIKKLIETYPHSKEAKQFQ